MAILAARTSLLRGRGSQEDGRVAFVELFFDLVFVFAVTQISHGLLQHLTPAGVLEAALLLLAVWLVWIYTTWVTNWLDPQRTPVRLMLFALMLAGLILSSSIPEAFAKTGLVFACAYVVMQVGRNLFMLWSLKDHSPGNYRNFQRIATWFSASALFWIAGGLAADEMRLVLWLIALAIEYAGPWAGYIVPGLGRSTTADWDVEGDHMAERCGLFIIIALGESILITGATFAGLAWTSATLAAFVSAFVGTVAMWWIYFNIGAERARHDIASSSDPGRMARLAYSYIHIVIVAGIIVVAAADELVLAHPSGHVEMTTMATVLGGPALYLLGNLLFKSTVAARVPLSHLVGLALLALIAPMAGQLSPLLLLASASAVLVIVAVWETISLRSYREQASRT